MRRVQVASGIVYTCTPLTDAVHVLLNKLPNLSEHDFPHW